MCPRLVTFLLAGAFAWSAAATEVVIATSGALLGPGDLPLTSAAQAMTFRLYDRAATTGEVLLWSGTCDVAVSAGYYTQLLGGGNCGSSPLDFAIFAGGAAVYLEVEVGAVKLAPRQALLPLPYAATSGNAATFGGALPGAYWKRTDTLDGAKLADGSVAVTALAAPLPLANVQYLSAIVATCPAGQALVGYSATLVPQCTAVSAGSSTGAILQWGAGTVDFGTATATTDTRTATLLNVGGATASAVTVTAPAGFVATPAGACATLAAGASCTVSFSMPIGSGALRTGMAAAKASTGGAAPLFLTGTLNIAPNGETAGTAAFSCSSILAAYPPSVDKAYWLDPDGAGVGNAAFQAYCDMTNGGWTLVLSSKIPQADSSWNAGAPTTDLLTTHASGSTLRLTNYIPIANITDFRFTCHASNASPTFGLDWVFPMAAGDNRVNLSDLYDDARLSTYGSARLTQDNGKVRLTGYDNPTTRADWGLGSDDTDGVWWTHEAWGQVDASGGHCQDPGTGSGTATLTGAGQFHIWVKTGAAPTNTGDGLSANTAGLSCRAIKLAYPGSTDGVYWIDADGAASNGAYRATCDMANGGWTLITSTKIALADPSWSIGPPYSDLLTTRATNTALKLVNRIPFSSIGAFRFTCYTSSVAASYGLDWTFNLGTGNNSSLLADIYADGNIQTYAAGQLTQSTGTLRLIGHDNATTKADWGLGSGGTDGYYWLHESWGQVDASGGHCQDPGTGSGTSTLGGAGIFHIWVK